MKRFRFMSVLAAMVAVSLIAAPGTSAAKKSGVVGAKLYRAAQLTDRDVVLRGSPRGHDGRLMMLPTAYNGLQAIGDPGRRVLIPNPDNGDPGSRVLIPNPDAQ